MFALRTSTSLSALGLVLGIAGTSWLTALTYERAPATRPFAEVVMPEAMHLSSRPVARPRARPESVAAVSRPAPMPPRVAATPRHVPEALVPVYTPSPRYPMSALRANREGQVILSVTVTPEGDVAEVSVGRSSGDMDLDHAAEEAVRNWRFASAENRAPRYTADLPVRFELTRPY
ncbi:MULTISPECIES: energy transducer TonB [Rhodanobacteraceae]|jgi:protein TonB|uniref:energy transducer TonB n=1 Tax=Rhodanobacteraceae TaxID=1775411 RepID=UPI00089079B9|nr:MULTISPECIES: energy transducer TonB [Rhodanobacteraceae]SDG32472.1 protein TonB [Dyella sp. 333MFSha]SKB67489.1 protein TonB [Luteibacter sp. 22Crub2.1]